MLDENPHCDLPWIACVVIRNCGAVNAFTPSDPHHTLLSSLALVGDPPRPDPRVDRTVVLPAEEECHLCFGRGYRGGSFATCGRCDGRGFLPAGSRNPDPWGWDPETRSVTFNGRPVGQ